MTAAWHRLAYIAACTLYVLGLVLLSEWRTWWTAVIVGVAGVLVAAGVAEDWGRVHSADRPPRPVSAAGDPRAQAAARRERRHGRLPVS